MAPIIRPARLGDAVHLAALIDMAGEGMPTMLWQRMAEEGDSPFQIGKARTMREEGGFSYRNAQLFDLDGEIAGALIGYPLEGGAVDFADLPPEVRGLVELELEVPGYWYVNVLAVYPEYRGRGFGTQLLDRADEIGRAADAAGMAIIVASGNNTAHRLYEKQGYRVFSRRRAVPFPGGRASQDWLLLTKPHS